MEIDEEGKRQRLLVVSNRLPVTISKDKDGKWTFKMSSGGLVSALSGLKKEMLFTWIGWPGFPFPFPFLSLFPSLSFPFSFSLFPF